MKHIASILANLLISFGVQGAAHFVIFADHYGSVPITRAEPILPLGIAVILIQGAILSFALEHWRGAEARIRDGLVLCGAFGGILVSYVALTEPAKYQVADIPGWIAVELPVGIVQWVLVGLAIGWCHSRLSRQRGGELA